MMEGIVERGAGAASDTIFHKECGFYLGRLTDTCLGGKFLFLSSEFVKRQTAPHPWLQPVNAIAATSCPPLDASFAPARVLHSAPVREAFGR